LSQDLAPEDGRLLAALRESDELRRLGCRVELGEGYGVLIHARDNAVGVWSYFDGMYRFRTLASWEPFCQAESIEDAVAMTLVLVD
jgi:hypothetical protein